MPVQRANSTFIKDKQNDPKFWIEIEKERDNLCRNLELVKGDMATVLVDALSKCRNQPCGLAACPLCMARSDRALIEELEISRKPPINSFLLRTACLWTQHWITREKILGIKEGIKRNFTECDLEIYEYVGRLNILSAGAATKCGPDCVLTFFGSMTMQPCYSVERGDLGFMDMDMVFCDNIYDPPTYEYFDKNVMKITKRFAGYNGFPKKDATMLQQCEIDNALTFGTLRCEDLIIRQPRNPKDDPRIN